MAKLLFDQNLSPKLVRSLQSTYPGSAHVSSVGLERATDRQVWEYARTHDFVIVTKDSDFSDINIIRGFPPKIVWLRLGNCATADIERALRDASSQIVAFASDDSTGVVEIY